MDGIPGSPDNLNLSPDGNIFVALVTVRIPGAFNPLDFMYTQPLLRKLAVRLLHILKFPFDLASEYVDFPVLRLISSQVRFLINYLSNHLHLILLFFTTDYEF